mmetsp:Transcript_9439/g.10350  ORF Transcript_9439/g.10350 Transcript_9439/m.10350 type:complete len:206 (+) Transcript_9439:492-1109(+)
MVDFLILERVLPEILPKIFLAVSVESAMVLVLESLGFLAEPSSASLAASFLEALILSFLEEVSFFLLELSDFFDEDLPADLEVDFALLEDLLADRDLEALVSFLAGVFLAGVLFLLEPRAGDLDLEGERDAETDLPPRPRVPADKKFSASLAVSSMVLVLLGVPFFPAGDFLGVVVLPLEGVLELERVLPAIFYLSIICVVLFFF